MNDDTDDGGDFISTSLQRLYQNLIKNVNSICNNTSSHNIYDNNYNNIKIMNKTTIPKCFPLRKTENLTRTNNIRHNL